MTCTYSFILVPGIYHALVCERTLEGGGIPCKLIPVPRKFSSDCGVCLRICSADRKRSEETLSANGTLYDRIETDV